MINTSIIRSTEKSESDYLQSTLQVRSDNVRNTCEKNKELLWWDTAGLQKKLRSHIWYFPNSLVYCPIAKVASSTWFLNFAKLLKVNLEDLKALKQSRTSFSQDIPFVKKNKKNRITKILTRRIVNNITSLNDKLDIKDMKKV